MVEIICMKCGKKLRGPALQCSGCYNYFCRECGVAAGFNEFSCPRCGIDAEKITL